jgi:NPCBM/NEW2 domain/Carbohydrate esterase, sialic acid-specific acetylesterase
MRREAIVSLLFFALKTIKLIYTQIILLSALSSQLFAQITVNNPLNKAVYQRNSSNQASIVIHGNLNQGIVSEVQARVINPSSGLPLSGFDWTSIVTFPIGGYYQGQINNIPAGWHRLEVRSLIGGVVLHTANVDRFGVGDVFLISGQSNAQGWIQNQYIGSNFDKVVTHNNGQYCSPEDIPFPVFTPLTGSTKISPNGRDAWFYGRLGDNLANQTGLPVSFFNAGASGAGINNFKESADNNIPIHALTGQPFCSQPDENSENPGYVPFNSSTYANKNPYLFFKKTLNYYHSMYGARAVLWHQGESDNQLGTSATTYQNELNYVINKSRADFNAALPWVIARASYFNFVADPDVIAGQNAVIVPSNQVYAGPLTDDINNSNPSTPGSRDAIDVHFFGVNSLNEVANRWTSALNPAFFSSSTAVSATVPPAINITYTNASSVTLILPGTYSSYKWIRTDLTGNSNLNNASEGFGISLTKSVGTYRCWVGTANGNLQISPEVNVTQLLAMLGNVGTCTANANISSLNYYQISNGQGPVEFNKTNGGTGDGDGVPIVLKGTTYASGLGVSPLSEISYKLPANQYYRFRSFIGIGDDVAGCSNTGGVVYKVYGDGNLIYTSPTIYRNSPLAEINVPIYSFTDLKLRVEAVSANATCNKAVWADARVICLGSDNIPPSTVGVITASDTLTKCISFQWPHATDNTDVKQYNLYKNGIKIDSVLASVNTYTLTGLSRNASVVFGVQAVDLVNNVSAIVTKTISTKDLIVDYGNLDDFVCVSRTYMPILKTPSNGVFTLAASYPGTTIGYTTGAFFSSVVSAPSSAYDFYYTINNSNPGCYDYRGFNLGTIAAPTSTPTITSDKSIINIGTAINLSSSSCSSGTLWWNFTNATTTSVSDSPIINNSYKASCRIAQCHNYSNTLNVKVLPNCYSALALASPADNLGSNINTLNYNSSNTISSSQVIIPSNTIQYSSANSILLQPGFSVSPGVKFTARIQNCPN